MEAGRPPAGVGTTSRIGCAAAGSLSYLLAAALGLFVVRGAIGAVLLISLSVITLSAGIAALLGPRLRARTGSGVDRPWVRAVGVALVLVGLALGIVGGTDLVSWAADR